MSITFVSLSAYWYRMWPSSPTFKKYNSRWFRQSQVFPEFYDAAIIWQSYITPSGQSPRRPWWEPSAFWFQPVKTYQSQQFRQQFIYEVFLIYGWSIQSKWCICFLGISCRGKRSHFVRGPTIFFRVPLHEGTYYTLFFDLVWRQIIDCSLLSIFARFWLEEINFLYWLVNGASDQGTCQLSSRTPCGRY
jgi:hypothetical protein